MFSRLFRLCLLAGIAWLAYVVLDKTGIVTRSDWEDIAFICGWKKEVKPLIPVRDKLDAITWYRSKPVRDAEYYIYLYYSRCPACHDQVPDIARQYDEMRKDGRVEMMLINKGYDMGQLNVYLDECGARFPVALESDSHLKELPCLGDSYGTPYAYVVTAEGRKLRSGNGLLAHNWRRYTVDRHLYVPRKKSFRETMQAEWQSVRRLFGCE